jgi:hypothetical protein
VAIIKVEVQDEFAGARIVKELGALKHPVGAEMFRVG